MVGVPFYQLVKRNRIIIIVLLSLKQLALRETFFLADGLPFGMDLLFVVNYISLFYH